MNTKLITGISLAAVFALSVGLLAANFAQEAQAGFPIGHPIVETVRYDNVPIKNGEVAVLVDTTSSGSMSLVHVAANLPCDESDDPLVVIKVGSAVGTLVDIISSSAEFTGFTGISGTCVYHASIDEFGAGGTLTDVILANFSGDNVPLPKGTTITINGVIPFPNGG